MSSDSYMELVGKLVSKQISPQEFDRRTNGQKEYLFSVIRSFLSAQISFSQFQDEYYKFVIIYVRSFLVILRDNSLLIFRKNLNGRQKSRI